MAVVRLPRVSRANILGCRSCICWRSYLTRVADLVADLVERLVQQSCMTDADARKAPKTLVIRS